MQILEKGLLPDLLHVLPVRDDSAIDGVVDHIARRLGSDFITDNVVEIFQIVGLACIHLHLWKVMGEEARQTQWTISGGRRKATYLCSLRTDTNGGGKNVVGLKALRVSHLDVSIGGIDDRKRRK